MKQMEIEIHNIQKIQCRTKAEIKKVIHPKIGLTKPFREQTKSVLLCMAQSNLCSQRWVGWLQDAIFTFGSSIYEKFFGRFFSILANSLLQTLLVLICESLLPKQPLIENSCNTFLIQGAVLKIKFSIGKSQNKARNIGKAIRKSLT